MTSGVVEQELARVKKLYRATQPKWQWMAQSVVSALHYPFNSVRIEDGISDESPQVNRDVNVNPFSL